MPAARIHSTIAALAFVAAQAATVAAAPADPAASAVLAPLPTPVTAADIKDAVKKAAGHVVLVNAWATWCVPCRQEMPDLLSLRGQLRDRGFDLILVTADFESAVPDARAFLGGKGVDFPTFHKHETDQAFIDGLDPTWSGALPFTILFDRQGRRVASWEGKESLDQLRARILPLIDPQGAKK